MAQTQAEFFAAVLRKKIEAVIEVHKDNLASGMGVKDIADYNRQVGIISGLRDAIELFDDAFEVLKTR